MARELGDPFLVNLGIDANQQTQLPSVSLFPVACNAQCLAQWRQAVARCVKKNRHYRTSEVVELWGAVLGKYLELCSSSGMFPFKESTEETNKEVLEQFIDKRHAVLTELYNRLGPLKSVVTTSFMFNVVFLDVQGFTVRALIEGSPSKFEGHEEDPSYLGVFTGNYGFLDAGNGLYKKTLDEGVSALLSPCDNNPYKYLVGYEITISTLPVLSTDIAPTKQDFCSFIQNILFKSVKKISPSNLCRYL